jgi:hypothetical protein
MEKKIIVIKFWNLRNCGRGVEEFFNNRKGNLSTFGVLVW